MALTPELADELKERIKQAPPEVSSSELARELGIHRNTVQKYRRQGREERREVARDVLERRVEAEMPNALAALGEALKTAQTCMRQEPTPQWVRETRESAKTLLDYVGKPDDGEQQNGAAEALERKLAALASAAPASSVPGEPDPAGS